VDFFKKRSIYINIKLEKNGAKYVGATASNYNGRRYSDANVLQNVGAHKHGQQCVRATVQCTVHAFATARTVLELEQIRH
jgi:hypothetical protein